MVLLITSSYSASLTSILTVQQLSTTITGIDSLITRNDPIGFQVGSFTQNYLIEELNIAKSRLIALGSPEEYAHALDSGKVVAVVDEQPYVDLFLSKYCRFQIAGDEFTRKGWGFVSISLYLTTSLYSILQCFHNNGIILFLSFVRRFGETLH